MEERMQFRTLTMVLLAGAVPLVAQNGAWRAAAGHPEVQYQVTCRRETATIHWRNGYPGAVTLTASVKSYSFEEAEQVTIEAAGWAESPLETTQCSPDGFQIALTKFAMAAPPKRPSAAAPADAKAPDAEKAPIILIPRYTAPQKLPVVSRAALDAVRVGMNRSQVLEKLGSPISQIEIPEENELLESLRYSVSDDQFPVVHLKNGIVSSVTAN
jgi:hypothetical protein